MVENIILVIASGIFGFMVSNARRRYWQKQYEDAIKDFQILKELDDQSMFELLLQIEDLTDRLHFKKED